MKRRRDAAAQPGSGGPRQVPSPAAPAEMEKKKSPQAPARGFLDWLRNIKIRRLILDVFILYASVPFILRLFPSLLTKLVFLSFWSVPFGVDFHKPELYLNHTRNFYLTSEPGVKIGIWHTLPESRRQEAEGQAQSFYEEALASNSPVIIYLHGNGGTRAMGHRILFAKVMSNADFHVLAVDYRGFGDSTGHPSEVGFTTDILHVYDWVKARSGKNTVILWGHSLGTGVATNVAKVLQERGILVDAIVLVAPFTNCREAAVHVPMSRLYRNFPGFEYLVLDSLARAGMYFRNDENVKVLSSPLLIVHAEDDTVMPLHQGKKLFEIARAAAENTDRVQFVSFPAKLGLGHEHISSHSELGAILRDFLNRVK